MDVGDYAPHQPAAHVAHYYGDAVRQLFVAAAALMLIGAPFYADSLRSELPFEIFGPLILFALAALANPHNKSVFMAGAVASGTGLVIYETWALYTYFESTWLQFILREMIAIVFLTGFYFSMKTVRAFILHTIGKHDEVGEFEKSSVSKERGVTRTWREEFIPWFLQNAGNSKRNSAKEKAEPETGPRMSPGRAPEETKPKYHPYEDTM